ncbi:tRNA pseudouridine(55) synthase TruB [Candidatus Nomurabacteria bacterium]|nr:tRNA pseudouridine(55) synthase TruB [Candidatus Nomurabacteria bacterium]
MKIENDILLVDKPEGWTSFDVVAKIRGKIRANFQNRAIKPTKRQLRVGHAGTLDPFATGLLIILIGDACKRADEFLKLNKTYEFTAKLGAVSSTGDTEGEISQVSDEIPTKDEVLNVLSKFLGEISQVPPAFSAIKINGQRAYKLAREGKEIQIPSRQVFISRLELLEYNYPYLKCVCDVSSGTYIRALVEDLGQALKSGAYCLQLRRTRVGEFNISDSLLIDKIV